MILYTASAMVAGVIFWEAGQAIGYFLFWACGRKRGGS